MAKATRHAKGACAGASWSGKRKIALHRTSASGYNATKRLGGGCNSNKGVAITRDIKPDSRLAAFG